MRVGIVTVGDELLSGDTENTNATWLCDRLDARGVEVRRVTTIPDDVADIARTVNEYYAEYDAVIVTGGLGPTHDDRTMEGVAAAFGRDLVEHADAVEWLDGQDGYSAADLADGTAHLPAGARLLENDSGVAPGAVVETVYVFPGVPDEMRTMFERVADEFTGTPRHAVTVEVDEPESALIDRLEELRDRFDVTVGSYPGETVRIKLTAEEAATAEKAAAWLHERVQSPE
ncbi:competence/damage-inducible protein A [Halopenitus persicus]|uniref:Competence/damage-inducible protein cinA n=1 Tax=Halopenitus persicus TaxID=1048396 RepID=A0A1H3JZ70_9EURY|nr:molybdopterin-binding protein [Halopenitus persicus]QHS15699.1 competence/damage-inducible protein A [haloarchaeon 3A1-DGR]SDY45216.1 competence/damage-inducible protein cinA [Halopenitus persicus]